MAPRFSLVEQEVADVEGLLGGAVVLGQRWSGLVLLYKCKWD